MAAERNMCARFYWRNCYYKMPMSVKSPQESSGKDQSCQAQALLAYSIDNLSPDEQRIYRPKLEELNKGS